jgi:hypothetical protein
MAVAVELFNPNDPDPSLSDNPVDPINKFLHDSFALDLHQFYVTVSAEEESASWGTLAEALSNAGTVGAHLRGRNFMTILVQDGTSLTAPPPLLSNPDGSHLDGRIYVAPYPESAGQRQIVVSLYRIGGPASTSVAPGGWLVDRIVLGSDYQARIPVPDGSEVKSWVVDYYRDCTDEPHFGRTWPGGQAPARWRMVTNLYEAEGEEREPDSGDEIDLTPYKQKLGTAPLSGTSFAPTIPLYTMNAGDPGGSDTIWWRNALPSRDRLHAWFFTSNPVHGAYRPASFPTVGFMHLPPR